MELRLASAVKDIEKKKYFYKYINRKKRRISIFFGCEGKRSEERGRGT